MESLVISFQQFNIEKHSFSTMNGVCLSIQQGDNDKPITRAIAICKTLSFLCKVAFAVLVLWSLFALVLMCCSIFSTDFEGELLPLACAVPFLYALYSANACILPFILGRMLGDISENRTPFTLTNANRLLLLAVTLLLYTLLEALLASVDSQFVLSLNNSSIEIGNLVSSFSSESGTTLNLFPLLMSAMFFALSYVFKYGVLLQQESDETL